MKTLAKYLTEYIDHEVGGDNVLPDDMSILREWIEQGIKAYQLTENCLVSIFGGDCPDCKTPMKYKVGYVLTSDGDSIEVGIYECPECGYEVYG